MRSQSNWIGPFVMAFWLALGPGEASTAAAETYPVGAAKIDITPDYPVRMSGYGNRRMEASEVAQRIWTKALAVGADGEPGPALLITVENCGMTPEIARQVAQRLAKDHGVRRERIAFSSTHSHTAPCLTNWAPYIFGMDIPPDHQAHIDQYTRELIDKMCQVGSQALANRKPGRLAWAKGKVGFAVNRRVLKDGKWTGFGVQADGPVDHSLPLLVAQDEANKIVAVVANYACHCTTLGGDYNQIAGDWAGYAMEFIEAANPGAVALITIGCGADANPNPRASNLELCRTHGKSLADEVQRLLGGQLTPLGGPLHCKLTQIDLPFATPRTRAEWEEAAKQPGAPGYHAQKFLARLDAGEEIPKSLSYPIGVWTFGDDLAMVFLGGEVVVDFAARLSEELRAERLWITAYTNDVCCYIPSKRILREGGYEADYSMYFYARPNRFTDDVEDLICDAVQKLTPHSFYGDKKRAEFPGPKSPEQALASWTVKPGFEIELVAAEPLVEDPVAFDWTPDGRLWVAEMRDYPNGMAWEKPGDKLGDPGGRVKLLTDTDGDGRYDQSTVFLDNIPFPTGVKSWGRGVLVTAVPDLFYAEDTDGDGRADLQKVLFSGFAEGNQQHRANGMRWGLDHWLYLANGDSGGTVKSLITGESVAIGGRDLRVDPDSGRIEAQTGQSQFGRCRDDWGNWFGCNNANPMFQFTIDDQYLRRNPHVAPPESRRDVPEQPGTAPVFPTSRTLARFNDFHTANRFTSACSVEIYRDTVLLGSAPPAGLPDGAEFAGHVFLCEPVHNLVHHAELYRRGLTFRSRRAADERQSEFLASSDNWSRPVMVRTGPDGALWVADMYREVIEHPEWIPQVWQRKFEIRAGSKVGRIYRVFPAGRRPDAFPRLEPSNLEQLVRTLDHPNGWLRDMAQQLLVARADPITERSASKSRLDLLRSHLKMSPAALGRLHAACALERLGGVDLDLLTGLLADPHPGVRRHAIQLSESHWNSPGAVPPAFAKLLAERAADDDPFVRQQLAYSLGTWNDPRAGELLAAIALRDQAEPYILAAVMSSLHERNLGRVFEELTRQAAPNSAPRALVLRLVNVAAAIGKRELLHAVLENVLRDEPDADLAARCEEIADVLEAVFFRSRRSPRELPDLLGPQQQARLEKFFLAAHSAVANGEVDERSRCAAMRLLTFRHEGREETIALLGQLLVPRNSNHVQSEAIQTLGKFGEPAVAEQLLAAWPRLSPGLRIQALDLMLSRSIWTAALLDAVAANRLPAAQIDAARRQQLERASDGAIRERAKSILGATSGSRQEVVDQYQDVLTQAGESSRGKTVFAKRCAVCHRLEDVGHPLGPDLAALTNRSPAALLVAMLDPNRAVEDKFLDYIAVLDDGRQFTGMLGNETSTSLTLWQQEGKQVTLLRKEIEELRSTGKSLMPEGMERDLSKQDFADVMAYLRSFSVPPKEFPGNHPELAHVRDDGSIHMLAMNARIYGPTLVFEEKYRNLGWWGSPADHALWSLNAPKSGVYSVVLDYACDPSAAGNRFTLTVGDQVLTGEVASTGGWDNYRSKRIGDVMLNAGPYELDVRSDGPIHQALFDLRAVRMTPRD